ncbi:MULTISPECIES: hypothetical protein [unclassified Bartonella]|uniref:hypothetical protein n=1 Tax=Bartonella TaxID=773 RepID=UPI0035CF7C7C
MKAKVSLIFLSNEIVQAVVYLSYPAYAVNTVLSGVVIEGKLLCKSFPDTKSVFKGVPNI